MQSHRYGHPFATSVFRFRAGRNPRSRIPASCKLVQRRGRNPTREPQYIQSMRKMFIALAIAALMGLILLVGGTAQNQGCLPWKTPVHVGGSAFSEGDRGHTYCR